MCINKNAIHSLINPPKSILECVAGSRSLAESLVFPDTLSGSLSKLSPSISDLARASIFDALPMDSITDSRATDLFRKGAISRTMYGILRSPQEAWADSINPDRLG